MTPKQKKLLLELQSKKENEYQIVHPFDVLIHSVLNTIPFKDLVHDYIDDILIEVKTSIFSNIEKRIKDCDNPESIYEDLKFILENGVDYSKSQRIRKVLEMLLLRSDDFYKSDFFSTFFYSKYSNDKKTALNYIEYAKKETQNDLLNEYLNTGNPKYLQVILQKRNIGFIAKNVKAIWSAEPSFFYKKQIIDLISKTTFETLKFIEEKEVDLYMLACLTNKKISAKDAMNFLDKVAKDKKHFSILNLSKNLEFKYVEQEIKKYIS